MLVSNFICIVCRPEIQQSVLILQKCKYLLNRHVVHILYILCMDYTALVVTKKNNKGIVHRKMNWEYIRLTFTEIYETSKWKLLVHFCWYSWGQYRHHKVRISFYIKSLITSLCFLYTKTCFSAFVVTLDLIIVSLISKTSISRLRPLRNYFSSLQPSLN